MKSFAYYAQTKLSVGLLIIMLLSSNMAVSQSKKSADWREMSNNKGATFYDVQKDFKKDLKKAERERRRETRKGISPGVEQEESGYEVYKRWESYMAPRVYPSGDMSLPTQTYENFKTWQSTYKANQNDAPSSTSGNWTELGPIGSPAGPSPYSRTGSGRVNFVRFDPTNPNIMYVGIPNGGLWKSTDAGATWTTNTDFLTIIGCSDLVIDPTNTNIMYLATGDLEGDRTSIGVLKSTDGGSTWNTTAASWPASNLWKISKLLMNPSNPSNMIIATNVGAYRTTNGWTTSSYKGGTNFKDMEFKPGDPNTIYAAGTSFWRSADNGVTWTNLTTSSGLPTSGVSRIALGVSSGNAAYVYALIGKSSDQSFMGMYRSTDNGTTFSLRASSPNLLGYEADGSDITKGQAFYDLAIAVSPSNAELVTTGGVNHWQSTDGGTTWSNKSLWNAGAIHADVHELNYLSGSSTTLFSCNDGGIFKSTDNGTTWNDISHNLAIAQIVKLGLSTDQASTIVVGEQDNGTNLRTGSSWNNIYGGDGGECFIDYTNNNTIYIQYVNGDFKRSDNGGTSCNAITSGLPASGFDFYSTWDIDPVNPNKLYVGGVPTLYTSINKGASWTALGTPQGTDNIIDFSIAPSNTAIIYAIKYDAISKSTNSGSSFSDITGTLPVGSASLSSVTVSNTDPNKVWVTFSGYSDGNKVYKSTNGGTTWTNISTGLPNLPVNTIVYYNGSATDAIYVGADVGVYYLDNTLSSWLAFNTSLPNTSVTDLEIFYPTGKIRAATYGRGVWESDIKTTTATWTGGTSTTWNTGTNWNTLSVPDNITEVIIPSGVNMPVFNGNFTVGSTCRNLTIQSGAQVTVSGNLVLNDGFTLNNNGVMKVGGNWTNNRDASYNTGSGTVEFYGNTASSISPFIGSPTYKINDNFTTWPGSWLGNIGTSGDSQFNQHSSIAAGGSSPEVMFYGAWTNPTNATKRLYQTINTTGLTTLTLQFKHMVDHWANGYTVKVEYSTDGTTWTDAGWSITPTVSVPANTVNLNLTSAQGVGSATYYIAFTITGNLYNINYWYIDDVKLYYYTTAETFYNLIDSKANNILSSTSGSVNVSNNLTIKPGAFLTNATGCTLNVTGTMKLESDASGTASYIDNGITNVSGSAIVQRYLTDSKWHLISSAVSGQSIPTLVGANPFATNGIKYGLAPYDNSLATPNWVPYTTSTIAGAGNFVVGKGYEAMLTAPTSLAFTGTLANSNQSIAVAASTNNWNLIGNPFPSSLFVNTPAAVTNNFIDANSSIFNSGYKALYVWDPETSLYRTINNASVATSIQPGQAFFINVASGGTASFTAAMRTHSAAPFYKGMESEWRGFDLNAAISGTNSTAEILFVPGTTIGLDEGYDAGMFTGSNTDKAIYTHIEGSKVDFGLQCLPENAFDKNIIPVGLNAPEGSAVFFTVNTHDLPANIMVYLEDRNEGKFTRLDESGSLYAIKLTSASSGIGRFYLHTSTNLLTGNSDLQDANLTVIPLPKENKIRIIGKVGVSTVATVYTISGQLLGSTNLSNSMDNEISFSPNANGVYLLKIQNGNTFISRKVVWMK